MRFGYFVLVLVFLVSAFCVEMAKGGVIRVEACIDGTSQLHLSQYSATWHHLTWAAPGRLSFANLPTTINGRDWYPVWPDIPDTENRWCNCFSDVFSSVTPGLPMLNADIPVRLIESRGSTTVVQQPRAENNFTLIVQFDDDEPVGAAWYIIEIDFTDFPVPIEGSTWGSIKALYD